MACLYTPKRNRERVSSYTKFYEEDDAPTFDSLTFPMTLRDIAKFEKENEDKDITVHVYAVHEWRDRKTAKRNSSPSDSDNCKDSISTMSDSEEESEPEEQMTEEDRAFVDDQHLEDESDVSMYRKMETDEIRKDMETPIAPSFKPKPHTEEEGPDNMRGYIYPVRIAPALELVMSICSLQKKMVSATTVPSKISMDFSAHSIPRVITDTFTATDAYMVFEQRRVKHLGKNVRIFRSI